MATPIRFITLALLILSVTPLSSSLDVVVEKETQRTEAEVRLMYERWLVENQKNYNALGEKERRFEIFKDSLNFIDQHNSVPDRTYEVGLTPFADLTNEEFRAIYLSKKMERPSYSVKAERYMFKEGDDLPDEVDWRKKGAVVPIKNQGKCGSCWAFSAIGAVEGINQIKTGELVSLSEQELMDCDRGVVNAGCDGGIMNYAFEFIVEKGGVESEQDYPYTAQDLMVCHATKNNTRVVTIDGYEVVPQNDELSLKKAVAHQPISVSIEAYNEAFKLYKSGVFTGKCGTFLDHGVIVVGYGSSDGEDYWIIRNSWGEKWGEGGYARLQRNFNETTGKCGVAIMPSYPIKKPVSSADLLTDI